MSIEARDRFREAAQKDGQLIERVITRVYKTLSEVWAKPQWVLDGGAHGGYHTFRMAELSNIAHVTAVEANHKTFEVLQRTWGRKPCRDKVELVQGALQGDEGAETVEFHLSPTHPGRSGINPVMRAYSDTSFDDPIEVKALTIDGLVRRDAGHCGFVKLDLEGGEYHALCGGKALLYRDRPVCVFENGPVTPAMNGYLIEDMFGLLRGAGLEFVTVFGDLGDEVNFADFWYAWAFPKEQLTDGKRILQEALEAEFPGLS